MTTDALWSAQEIKTQAEQVPGQLDVWVCIALVERCTCSEPAHALSISPCPRHGEDG